MGLCTSKSTVTLDPSAQTLSADGASQAEGEGVSPEGTLIFGKGILMVQPVTSKAEGGGGGTKSGAKGYLELGGKGRRRGGGTDISGGRGGRGGGRGRGGGGGGR
ncbi:hypothetical protein CgunFtcFv8_018133 [Champsocephalus gunnari]|uniref:Uncharacterized protein n=1 Tax=Champsocephalus gunnari TaxID=52237 RepID=A0AAN8DSA7_CHAGU|nr:hypothetical protein CgunFtcFv8_018133 [Champsocephalus gunnari]